MPSLRVSPAPNPGSVHFAGNGGGRSPQPSVDPVKRSVGIETSSISGQLAKSDIPPSARLPLTQWNQSAAVSPQNATVSRFDELVAEADALLHTLKTVRPVKAEEPTDTETALADKRQQAAPHNKLAIVRVRVAGKTFGVPAALARRIAVYSDNATKQLQLDRQCRAYEKQRRLRASRPAEDIDHVLLNKAAIVLPAVPLTGRDVLPLMIQTAREHEQGSKHKTKTRPTSAAPQISRPDVTTSASHKDAQAHLDDQGHQQLVRERAAGSSHAVAPCAIPVLDSPCPGEQSARESVASPRVLTHSSIPAAIETLTSQNASVLLADTTVINHAPMTRAPPRSEGEQASTTLNRKGRPASATAPAAASTATSSTRPPTRTFSGTLSKCQAAMPAVNSQAGQHTNRDYLLPQDALLQPPSNSTDSAAGPTTKHFSQRVQRKASQAAVIGTQPELGQATLSRFTLRRPSKLTLLANEPNSQDVSLSPLTCRRSPKPTLLRDQHMPGELLHQRSAFPSDILMRHEAACASPTSSQPDTPLTGARPSSPSSTLQHRQSIAEAQIGQAGGSTLRPKSPKGTLLRDQHLPGELLHKKTAFPSDIYMRHEAACAPGVVKQLANDANSVLEVSSTAVTPQQEQLQQVVAPELRRNSTLQSGIGKQSTLPRAVSFAAALMQTDAGGGPQAAFTGTGLNAMSKDLTTRPTRMEGDSTLPSPRATSKEMALDLSLLQSRDPDGMQAAAPLELHRKGSKGAGPQPKSSLKRGDSRLQQSSPKFSLKRADSRLQHSSEAVPATPRSPAGPWFEATHHDLTRCKTWAREWLEMGAQDFDPTSPDFEQLQQQQQLSLRKSDYQSSLLKQQATQQHAVQQPIQQQAQQLLGQQQHSEQNTSQEQPKVQTQHQAWQHTGTELLLPSPGATARSQQHQAVPPAALGTVTNSAQFGAQAMQQQTSNGQLSQRQGRPQTAPEGFWSVAADAPWALDARRLHSARPGSGGSPTARKAFLAESQSLWQQRRGHQAEVRQRRLQFQKEKYQHQLQAAGFVVGLPEAQKRRLWRSTWLHMVAAYRLHHACRSHVQQHRNQQAEARCRAAAVKIAGWYKRCVETRPARLTLKARRQLLPLTSLDKKQEEEQKAAAAAAILELLKDIQRGHRFARAVKDFLCKVRAVQKMWRDAVVVRRHQRLLLFMQLQRFAERHAAKLVRTGAAFLTGTLGATSAITTRKGSGTMSVSCLRRSRPGSGRSGSPIPPSPRGPPALPEVVDAKLQSIRKQFSDELDAFWDARTIYQAQLEAHQLRAQALSLRSSERMVGITAPKKPHFRLLQSNPELKVMLVQCHEIQDASNSLIEQGQSLKTTAKKAAFDMEDDDQLQDTMLAAYWAAVNI